MLNAYYRWVFSLRGKRVTRLKFFEGRSKVFRRSLGTLVNASAMQDGRRGELKRRISRALLICGWISSGLLIAWMIWESRWVFEIY